MSPDRADELSYGDERSAPLWPRGWLVITAVIAGAALAVGMQLGRRRNRLIGRHIAREAAAGIRLVFGGAHAEGMAERRSPGR